MVDASNNPSNALAAASAPDVQATYCSTLVDEWIELGVRHAVIAPGSRSTPLALAIAARDEVNVQVVHDERVAAFMALGIGLAGTPALLLCTSGTAAANFCPAVVEAGLSGIPMLVLTADRPDELRGVGAPQTIDQPDLYGRHVRWSHDADVADAADSGRWRTLAQTAWTEADAGPVQLNLPFREPLVGTPLELPARLPTPVPDVETDSGDPVPAAIDSVRGAILAGGSSGVEPAAVQRLHDLTRWPIIADAMSHMRHLDGVVSHADALLRNDGFAADHLLDVIVRVGRPAASKVLAQWSAPLGIPLIQVGGPGRIDPAHNVTAVCTIEDLLAAVPTREADSSWELGWEGADTAAGQAITQFLAAEPDLSEAGVARAIVDHLPPDAHLTASSSMPVRDVEWYGGPNAAAHTNRGANGIDGVISTALGRTLDSGATGVVLIGDLAFVHDSNALVGLVARDVDLRIVVVDNDGGGIFSFLPQATTLEHERFEQLFGTPLGTDVLALAASHGLTTATATTREELVNRLAEPGPWVCRVPSDRALNVEIHVALNAAAVAFLG